MSPLYAGVAADERQAARRARLLEATLDLAGGEGWRAITVRAVCARAQLTARYFYESFADREALLVALFDQVAQECAAAVLSAVEDAPPDAEAKSRAAIKAFVNLVTDDPRLARVLFGEPGGSEEALTRRRFAALRMFADLVAAQGREFYGVPGPADPLLELTALMVVGGLAETLLAWLDGSLPITRDALIEDCAALFAILGDGAARLAAARAS